MPMVEHAETNHDDLLPVPTNVTATGSTPPRDPVGVQCSIVDKAQTSSGKMATKVLCFLDSYGEWQYRNVMHGIVCVCRGGVLATTRDR